MASAALDTLSVSRRLEAAGFTRPQADAMAGVVSEAADPAARDLVTKKDVQIEFAPVRADIGLLKWMVGANFAFTVAVLAKLFLG